jgi:hypothetical protein
MLLLNWLVHIWFLLLLWLWYGLYHHGDMYFRRDVPSIVLVSLVWLNLPLRGSICCLLVCWRCVVLVSIVPLPPWFWLLVSYCLLQFNEWHTIFHCVSWYSLAVDVCVVHVAWPIEHILWWLVVFSWTPWLNCLLLLESSLLLFWYPVFLRSSPW